MLYAKYFLYILNNKKTLDHALKTRAALFEAAKIPIDNDEKLEAFLQKKGIQFKIFATEPVFATLQNYIREDVINSTPTCIILNGNKKEIYNGYDTIPKALENLKQPS